ncbi:MAG: hypothetical protein LUH47_00200 [Clostridiales bacterium]|nr:hypothetical protein [Clostridiales bacterium]
MKVKKVKPSTFVSWVDEAKQRFKKGDEVMARVKFGSSIGAINLVGTVEEVYANFITVMFSGKFKQSYTWADIKDNEVVAF